MRSKFKPIRVYLRVTFHHPRLWIVSSPAFLCGKAGEDVRDPIFTERLRDEPPRGKPWGIFNGKINFIAVPLN
jgi:hypothetical protein